MTKSIPDKCKKCAMLSASQAQELHGNDGDRCWNPNVCYSRRSYARHRDRRNLVRARKRSDSDESLVVNMLMDNVFSIREAAVESLIKISH